MPTGDAYSSGHLVPSLWDLHMFYLLRPILFRTCLYFTGLWSSNIPRYFLDFASSLISSNHFVLVFVGTPASSTALYHWLSKQHHVASDSQPISCRIFCTSSLNMLLAKALLCLSRSSLAISNVRPQRLPLLDSVTFHHDSGLIYPIILMPLEHHLALLFTSR